MPAPLICKNSVANGNAFLWDFGDGTKSKSLNPTHYYLNPGTYSIKLIVTDTVNCNSKDSVFFQVKVKKFSGGIITPPSQVCKNIPFQLEAFGGNKYLWSPENQLNNSILDKPIASIDKTTNFSVNVSDECGSETFNFTISVFNSNSYISKDTSICIGGSASLFATGGASYKWIPSTYLNNATIQKPISNATQTITYFVNIITPDGCLLVDSTKVTVFTRPPNPILSDTLYMCSDNPITIKASGAEKYNWSPNNKINTIIGNTIIVNPTNDATYFCKFENACGVKNDSVFVDVMTIDIITGKDTIICPKEAAYLSASGGIKYNWYENSIFIDSTTSKIIVHPKEVSIYTVIGSDKNGCKDTASFKVNLFPNPIFEVGPDIITNFGEQVQLGSISNSLGNYVWTPSEYLTCTTCSNPIANPDKNFEYNVNFTDINGCKASDNVKIIYTGLLYVPNSFTPDGNKNSLFKAEGSNINTFEISIFNRWGELVFISNTVNEGWDGTYKGIKCQDGTYIWKIIYSDYYSPKKELVGHINLLR
jgi:gliding motility-associated-like protein